jgi:hypothetical protein
MLIKDLLFFLFKIIFQYAASDSFQKDEVLPELVDVHVVRLDVGPGALQEVSAQLPCLRPDLESIL